jgi:hypothetical protein
VCCWRVRLVGCAKYPPRGDAAILRRMAWLILGRKRLTLSCFWLCRLDKRWPPRGTDISRTDRSSRLAAKKIFFEFDQSAQEGTQKMGEFGPVRAT